MVFGSKEVLLVILLEGDAVGDLEHSFADVFEELLGADDAEFGVADGLFHEILELVLVFSGHRCMVILLVFQLSYLLRIFMSQKLVLSFQNPDLFLFLLISIFQML